jgi:energy-coupling factor transport system permease protein
MQIHFAFRETWLHRVNPSFKLLATLALFAYVLFSHNPNVMINLAIANAILLFAFSGHPIKRLLLFSIPIALLFVSSMTSMVFYGKGQTTWWQWGLIHITEESFFRGLQIGLKSLNFAFIGLIFALTTRPVYLFYSLMQQCKVPPKFAYSFMAGIRLVPMMAEEFQTLRHALAVRGAVSEKSVAGWFRTVIRYSIPLLAQSIRRAQRIAVAMEAKRFAGNSKRTYYYKIGFSAADAVFAAGIAACCWTAYAAGIALPYVDVTDVRTSGM